jgi:hypothetical protein
MTERLACIFILRQWLWQQQSHTAGAKAHCRTRHAGQTNMFGILHSQNPHHLHQRSALRITSQRKTIAEHGKCRLYCPAAQTEDPRPESKTRRQALHSAPPPTERTCRPKWIISRASTLAVVVPSPAESLVRPATCNTPQHSTARWTTRSVMKSDLTAAALGPSTAPHKSRVRVHKNYKTTKLS